MADEIYVAPGAAAAVIRFGGICYYRVGPTDVFPDIFSATPFSSCDECAGSSSSGGGAPSGSSSSSSSSSSEGPINCAIMDPDSPEYMPPDDPSWPATIQVTAARIQSRSTAPGAPCIQNCSGYSETLTKVAGQYVWFISGAVTTSCLGIGCGVELVDNGDGTCAWTCGFGPLAGPGADGSIKLTGNMPYGSYPDFGAIQDCSPSGTRTPGNGGSGISVG